MNEMITPGREMAGRTKNLREILTIIKENMLKTRPKREVYYQPFCEVDGIRFEKSLANRVVDLNRLYPDAREGDFAFVDFDIRTDRDYEIYLNIRGNLSVTFEGKYVFSCFDGKPKPETGYEYGHFNIPVTVRAKAHNRVRVKCVKAGGKFGFSFILSIRRYPGMWANDYIYACRPNLPVEGLKGEEGLAVSELYRGGCPDLQTLSLRQIQYAFPRPPQSGGVFDFTALCADGDTAYVFTVARNAHRLEASGSIAEVFVNARSVPLHSEVQAGDSLLFRCTRHGEEKWLFDLGDESRYELPFLISHRKCADRAVWLGPFYGTKIHPPEFGIDWSKVYCNEKGEKLYWRFCDNSRLRVYLDSVFYGQWFYALMVGFYGIRRASQVLNEKSGQNLFCDNMHFLAQYFDYVTFDAECEGMPAFMPRAIEIPDLDNIGTMGMNLVDAYFDSNDESLIPLIKRLEKYLFTRIRRFEDGSFHREDTMWADDVYMSCPFLVRLGRLTGDAFYFREAVRQIRGFRRRLYMEDKQIFSHIYFLEEGIPNRIPWGRGNGWIFWSLTEMLLYMEQGEEFEEIKQLFCEFAQGLRRFQDKSGLWRQVLDREEEGSYLETSCTAMFLLGFVRGMHMGWLDCSYRESAAAAWDGLISRSIDWDGNVYGVCMGSGRSMEPSYYYQIPTIANDDHGTGVILTAGAEYLEFLEQS